jgi:hypothetical protein
VTVIIVGCAALPAAIHQHGALRVVGKEMRLGNDPLDHAIIAHRQSLGLDSIDSEFDRGGASVQN